MTKAGEQPTITQADYTWADWQLAEQCVSAANVVTCDGYYEVDIEKVAETLAKARTTSLAAQSGITPEWCLNMAKQEEGDIGAGLLAIDPAPSLAAQDGLVEALEVARPYVQNVVDAEGKAFNKRDLAKIDAALSAIKGDKS